MKSHDEIRGWLPAMAGDELSAADRALVEQHLADCPACCRELAQLQAVMQAVRSTPELDAPTWLASRIMARVREEAVPRRSWLARLSLPLQLRLPLEVFALLTVCVIAWQVMQAVERSAPVQPMVSSPHAPAGEVAEGGVPVAGVSPQAGQAELPKAKPLPIVPPAAAPVQQSTPTPQPVFERAEQAKKEVESSVPAPGLRDQAAGLPAPPDQRAMAAKRTAEPAGSSKAAVIRPLLRLRIVAAEPAMVAERLRPMVERLGGSLLESDAGHAVIKLEAVRLPAFMEQLARLGRITEQPTGALPREGWVELQLSW